MSARLPVSVNGNREVVATEPDTALLYVLRNHLGLKGTRFGCGLGTVRVVPGADRRAADLLV